jgi:hypothetical protein
VNNADIGNSAAAALGRLKDTLHSFETDAETGAKTLVVRIETGTKSFYERHLPIFYAIGGAAVGAILMLARLKL